MSTNITNKNTSPNQSPGSNLNTSIAIPAEPTSPKIVNPYTGTAAQVTPSKRPGPPPPPTVKKPKILLVTEKNKYRGAVHCYTTSNNGDATCQLQLALVTKHYNPNLTYYMPEIKDSASATKFLEFCMHHKYCDRRNLVQYVALKVKSFSEGTNSPLQSRDNFHGNFICFIGKVSHEDDGDQASICPTSSPKEWGMKFCDTLKEFLNMELNEPGTKRRWKVSDFDLHMEKVKYNLSRVFYDEDLWNILHLLWDVDDPIVFNQILEHDATLEMIFGTTTDANTKSHMQKQLRALKKTVLEETNLE